MANASLEIEIETQMQSNQSEWPIYLLADYDNSGNLLDLCRSNLAVAAATANTRREPSMSGESSSGRPKNNNNPATSECQKLQAADGARELSWWRLIERDKQDLSLECYREPVLQVCAALHKAVR